MGARTWKAGLAACVALSLAAPVGAAVLYARHQARATVLNEARLYAREVLHRSEATADQVQAAVDKLRALPGDPCSPEHKDLMRDIDLGSSYVQAIGHVVGDNLVCSSLSTAAAVDLGPAQVRSPAGVLLRTDVRLAPTDTTSYVVIEQAGYAAIIHKLLPLDVSNDTRALALATVSTPGGQVLTSRGALDPRWPARAVHAEASVQVDGSRAVAVVGSSRWNIAAVAALSGAALTAETRHQVRNLLPAGVVVGLVLAVLVLLQGRRRLALPAELRAAVRRGELHLEYQPIVELSTRRVVGAEALLRWVRPDGRSVRPDLFVPVAEESGLMPTVTRYVLRQVLEDWPALSAGRTGFHVAVNISPHDLLDADLVREICALRVLGPRAVIVEITERGMLDREGARSSITRLRANGLAVAVDDFGTGYSSLSYLESFELDLLKIDKAFVDTLGGEAATSHVASHIIDMARALGLRLVAEGVEREEQAAYLTEHGVELAQGWLFGRPQPVGSWVCAPVGTSA